jgi:hypothetical protein
MKEKKLTMKIIKTSANKFTDLVYGIQEVQALYKCEIIRIEIVPVFDIRKEKPEKPELWDFLFYISEE